MSKIHPLRLMASFRSAQSFTFFLVGWIHWPCTALSPTQEPTEPGRALILLCYLLAFLETHRHLDIAEALLTYVAIGIVQLVFFIRSILFLLNWVFQYRRPLWSFRGRWSSRAQINLLLLLIYFDRLHVCAAHCIYLAKFILKGIFTSSFSGTTPSWCTTIVNYTTLKLSLGRLHEN